MPPVIVEPRPAYDFQNWIIKGHRKNGQCNLVGMLITVLVFMTHKVQVPKPLG